MMSMASDISSVDLGSTSLESPELLSSSVQRANPLKSAVAGTVLGVQQAISIDTQLGTWIAGSGEAVCEFNQRQAQVCQLYLQLLERLGSIARSELEPGGRREVLGFLKDVSSSSDDIFLDAFERIYYTTSKKVSDRTKSSALRFCSDFAIKKDKSKYISFLINQLGSMSPAQASAAAVGLSEIADNFSIPALLAAKQHVMWSSVQDDIGQTIDEISSQ